MDEVLTIQDLKQELAGLKEDKYVYAVSYEKIDDGFGCNILQAKEVFTKVQVRQDQNGSLEIVLIDE